MARLRIRWNRRRAACENARRHLPNLIRDWFAEGRRAARRGAPASELHQFRLHTKRLRYTLELFRSCYGKELAERLGALRQIQDALGAMSDCVTTRLLVAHRLPEGSAGRRALETFLARRAGGELARFTRHWQRSFASPAEERRWLRFLAG